MAPHNEMHSTGRGGSGNIGKGEGIYTAGDIVREGPVGESGRKGQADYSAGRGGTGNIGHQSQPGAKVSDVGSSSTTNPLASDYVPESATTEKYQEDYHTGRGGEGNVHRDKYGGHSKPTKEQRAESGAEGEGFLQKMKHKIKGDEAF